MDSPPLKKVQLTILHHLYRFRFLTSLHLCSLINHTIRSTNYNLKVLTDKSLIIKRYSRKNGLANQPALYFLSRASIKVFESQEGYQKKALNKIPKEIYRSPQFIAHSTFIASFYLYLEKDAQKTQRTLYFFTKTDLLAHPYIIQPLPDAYFASFDDSANAKRYFLELIDEGTPRFALRRRIQQYNDYLESGQFEAVTHHPFPTILFIAPTIGVLIYLKKHISRIYDETSLDQTKIYFTTVKDAFRGKWETIEIQD